MSYSNVSTTNNFLSSGSLVTRSMVLGGSNDNSKSHLLQESYFGVGSAYTQGNVVRSFYDMNSGPALKYTPTSEDILRVKLNFRNLFKKYPILNNYPWFCPYTETYPSVIENSGTQPIYNILGKGLGKIEIYKVGNIIFGDYIQSKPLWMNHYYNFNITGDIPLQPMIRNITNTVYPFSGKLYSGNLVQYSFEGGDCKVIPYQAGRGVPQWDHTQDYYSGNPYGIPKLPNGIVLEPFLSPGVSSGNNEFCVGVSLDSMGKNKLFPYPKPIGMSMENLKNVPYDDHPAPQSVGPVDVSYSNISKLQSPGPNTSNTTWAPWPWYYAYNSEDEVPIISEGKTSVKIGASLNIGMQCYYEPDVEPGDDPRGNPKYIPVQTIPLFQGEKVLVGSDIYSSAMGHVITWDRRGVSPYPIASAASTSGLQIISDSSEVSGNPVTFGSSRDSRDENPWWDWWDPTFGAIGWTSTPGFSLSGVPDEGIAICQSRELDLPYLNQSLQGSSIVRASTVKNPLEVGGSGRMELLGSGEYNNNENKFQRINKVVGDSERSQIIGNSLQEIEGSGQWTYDGSFEADTSNFINGYDYSLGTYDVLDISGDGKNGLINVTSVDSNGSINGISWVSLGSGYSVGGLTRLIKKSDIPVGSGTPGWSANTAIMVYDPINPILDCRGNDYVSKHGCLGFNITKNSGLVEIQVSYRTEDIPIVDLPAQPIIGYPGRPLTYKIVNVKNINQFTPGRVFYALNFNTSNKLEIGSALAVFYVLENDGTDVNLGIYWNNPGDSYAYEQGKYKYAIQWAEYYEPLELSVIANDNGQVDNVKITNYGRGSENGDLILVYQHGSGNNYIFNLNMGSSGNYGYQLINGGGGYKYFQTTSSKWKDIGNFVNVINNGIDTGTGIRMISATNCGNISNLSWQQTRNYTDISDSVNKSNNINADLGSKNIVSQTVLLNYQNQPAPLDPFSQVWDNNAVVSNATFILEGFAKVIFRGSGYIVGETTVVGGSGIGMVISINQVSENGEVLDVSIKEYGTGMRSGDICTLGTGDCKVLLRIKNTDNVSYFFSPGSTIEPNAYMMFDFEIVISGSGYTVGTILPTICNNRAGVGMQVKILEVGIGGYVQAIELVTPGNDANYNLGNIILIDGGGRDCYFKLIRPLETHKIKWHKSGTNYITATNVPTINMQANNLILLANVASGSLVPYDYNSPSYYRPPIWDLSRYKQNDIIQFIQGNNNSSSYSINFDSAKGDILFTPVSSGSGYTFVNNENGWFGTLNSTEVVTTVDILANSDGEIVSVTLNTLGDRFKFGDDLLINQPGSDKNAVVRVQPLKNVTPNWENEINGRNPTSVQWNTFNTTLKSAKNLFDDQIVIDMKMNYPNYYNNTWYNNGDGGRDYVNNVGGMPECSLL